MIKKKSKVKIGFQILAMIIATVVVFHIILWQFISTDAFNKYLTRFINSYVNQYTEVSIKYEKLQAKLFPPGIIIHDIEVQTLVPLGDFRKIWLKSKRIDVDLTVFTASFNKLQISNINVSESKLDLDIDKNLFQKKNKDPFKWDLRIYELLSNALKVNIVEISRLGLNNLGLHTNYGDADIERLSWEIFDKKINMDFSTRKITPADILYKDLQLPMNSWQKEIQLDLLAFNADFNKSELILNSTLIEAQGQRIEGQGFFNSPFDLTKMNQSLSFQVSLFHDDIPQFANLPWHQALKSMKISQFSSRSKINIKGSVKKPEYTVYTDIENIKTGHGNFKFLTMELSGNERMVEIKKIVAKDAGEGILKSDDMKLNISLENKTFLNMEMVAELENVDLSNALSAVPAVASFLRGKTTGRIKVLIDAENDKYKISTLSKVKVDNFKLQTKRNKILLEQPIVYLENSYFDILPIFALKGDLSFGNTLLSFSGNISDKKIDISTSEFNADFDSLKHIAGIKLTGMGKMQVRAEGALKSAKLIFTLNEIQHTSVLDFYLGALSGIITVDFANESILFGNMHSKLNPGTLSGDGMISLNDYSTDLRFSAKSLSTLDLLMMHKPVLPWDLSFLEQSISTSKIDYKLGGKINNLNDLTVQADVATQRLTFLGEEIYDLKAIMLFKNKIFSIPSLDFKKGRGSVQLGMSADINDDSFKLAFKSKNLVASDLFLYKQINPSFSSAVQFEGAYKRIQKMSDGVFNFVLSDSRLNGEAIDDSYLAVQWKDGVAKIQGKYADNWGKLNAAVDFNQSDVDLSNKSFATVSYHIPDWGKLFNFFSSFDVNDPVLKGKLNLELDALFNVKRWKYADVDLWIKELSLSHPNLGINKTKSDRIVIEKGHIKKWDIVIKGLGRDQLMSRAHGHLSEGSEIENVFDFSLGKLNYFLGSYLDLSGFVKSQLKVKTSRNSLQYLGKVFSADILLNSKNLFSTLGKTKLQIEFDNRELRLVQWMSEMGRGLFSATGVLAWNDLRFLV